MHVADTLGRDRRAQPADAVRRLQRHPEAGLPPLEHLQRRADAVHAAHHLVGRRAARGREHRSSGVARLHPHAARFCGAAVSAHQGRRARHRRARRVEAGRVRRCRICSCTRRCRLAHRLRRLAAAPEATRTAQAGDDTKRPMPSPAEIRNACRAAPATPEPAKTVRSATTPKRRMPRPAKPKFSDRRGRCSRSPAPRLDGLPSSSRRRPRPAPDETDKLRGSAAMPAVTLDHPAACCAAPGGQADGRLSKPDRRDPRRRSRSSSAARKRRFTCGRISSRCSTRRSPSTIRSSRSAPTSSRRWTYLDDRTTFRWNVVSLPGEPPKPKRERRTTTGVRAPAQTAPRGARQGRVGDLPPPQTPAEALARIEIPPGRRSMISAADGSGLFADRVRSWSRRRDRRRHGFHRRHALSCAIRPAAIERIADGEVGAAIAVGSVPARRGRHRANRTRQSSQEDHLG